MFKKSFLEQLKFFSQNVSKCYKSSKNSSLDQVRKWMFWFFKQFS